jgi:hypothetical protein
MNPFLVSLAFFLCALSAFSQDRPLGDREVLKHFIQAASQMEGGGVFDFLKEAEPSDERRLAGSIFTNDEPDWETFRKGKLEDFFRIETGPKGAIGELFLNRYARQWVKEHPGTVFVNSEDYDAMNPEGARPDGLIVRRHGNGIVVEAILESKVASAGFSEKQLRDTLRIWKAEGLRWNETEFALPPQEVFFRRGDGLVMLSQIHHEVPSELNWVKANVFLGTTRDLTEFFVGKNIVMPFSAKQLVALVTNGLLHGYTDGGKVTISPESLARARARKRKTASRSKGSPALPREKEVVPKDKLVRSNENALVHFIQEKGRFPRLAELEDPRYLERLGGRMGIFAGLLDAATRKKLVEAGGAPASGPMDHWILSVHPLEDSGLVAEILRIHIDLHLPGERAKPFLERLRRDDPNWGVFFASDTGRPFLDKCHPALKALSPSPPSESGQ